MFLKEIAHYFCGRSLEKETAKTNSLICEAEQREKVAIERLEAQADYYKTQFIAYKNKRDAELKEFMAFMNKQLGLAEVYVPHLGDFQDKIFTCFDSWMNISSAEQKIQLLSERITTKFRMRDFITALQVELNKLTQRNERNEWRQIIKERPILVSSTFIERTVRQVSNNQKGNSESIRHDLNRLKSHSMTLQTEIKELRHERDLLVVSSRELIEKHKLLKAELNDQYRKCNELFCEIKDGFCDHFVGSDTTGNSLADSWIAEIEGAATLPKLLSKVKETADIQREAQDKLNDLSNQFQYIRLKIYENHQSGDFSTFKENKDTRDRLFQKRQEVEKRKHELVIARQVLFERCNKLKEKLGNFDSLEPDESIRRIVEIFRTNKDFDVYRVIGVSTREDRRRHYELKNPKRQISS